MMLIYQSFLFVIINLFKSLFYLNINSTHFYSILSPKEKFYLYWIKNLKVFIIDLCLVSYFLILRFKFVCFLCFHIFYYFNLVVNYILYFKGKGFVPRVILFLIVIFLAFKNNEVSWFS